MVENLKPGTLTETGKIFISSIYTERGSNRNEN
jgi:hypothetical protein